MTTSKPTSPSISYSQQMNQAAQWKPKGYPKLARLMGRSNDVAIFRRFNELNMLNLLSLQAEIANLQRDYHTQCKADDISGIPLDKLTTNFQEQRNANAEQYSILLQLREKMKEYNDLLLQISQLSHLNRPLKQDLSFLRTWLQDPTGGADFLAASHSIESFLYEPQHTHDLLTLSHLHFQPPESDPFTRLLRKTVVHWYHILIGQRLKNRSRMVDEESQTVHYEEGILDKSASLVATVLSSTLPIIAIVILNQWKSTQTRIYIAVGITAAFAFILTLFTNARRVEIFAATATFAAVEVVFIGSVNDGRTP